MLELLKAKDVVHNVVVKFVRAFLPSSEKPYNLRPVLQKELDIRGLVHKASAYNLGVSPRALEQDINIGFELMAIYAAEGYKVTNPFFTVRLCFGGEYDGTETRLPDDVVPEIRLIPTPLFRNYIKENVNVVFDGKLETEGFIAGVLDESTGLDDGSVSIGRLMTVHGGGMKISYSEEKKNEAGFFWVPKEGDEVKAVDLAVNEPGTLKVIVPAGLIPGVSYKLVVRTQSSLKGNYILKELREICSDFTVIAR